MLNATTDLDVQMKAPTPHNESQRLEVLRQYEVLDTAPEKAFDNLARLAALACETPLAMIKLTDTERIWVKAKTGLDVPREIPREVGFSSYTILQRGVFIVPDALSDERFASSPLVASGPKLRFYGGAPLITPEGYALGAICVFDRVPRNLNAKQKKILSILADQVVILLDWRRRMNRAARINTRRPDDQVSEAYSSSTKRNGLEVSRSSHPFLQHLMLVKDEAPITDLAEKFKHEILRDAGYALLREAGYFAQEEAISFGNRIDFYEEVKHLEIKLIEQALAQTGGKQKPAARLLNLKPSTLHAKVKQYRIAADSFSQRRATTP
jgi:DNA-binding protein Fis